MFEDVHWMDDASSDLLRHLGTQLPTRPWLACTTRRAVEGGFAAAEGTPALPALTLRLEPLPVDDAKTLVHAAAGDRRLTDEELAALMERGAGNPLFLQELASPAKALDETEQMPDTVEELVATRIDRLAPGDRSLLRWASVLGVSFPGALIAGVLEDDPTAASDSESWDRLAEFVERDPDVPGTFRFRHALIRDGAYEGLSYRRRRELHGRVAEVIERRAGERPADEAELLSLHFNRAARWPEAWHYSIEAGRRAEAKYANVEAAQFFEGALEVARRVPDVPAEEVARVWEALGEARMRLGQFERAGAAYRESRGAFPGDAVEQARLIQKESMAPLRLARYPQALRRLTQALRIVEDVEGDAAAAQRARLYGWYATVLQYQRRPRDAITWCERTIAEAEPSGARDALAHAYFILDWAYAALGRLDEAVYSARAIEIYEELGDLDRLAWVLNNLGGLTYLRGRWDEALQLAERARETFKRIGDESQASIAALNIAEVRSDQGRMEGVEPVFREALDVRRAAGNPLKIADAASVLGRHLARVGNLGEARPLLEEARELFAQEGDEEDLLTTDAWLCECFVHEGDNREALMRATEALARSEAIPGVSVVVTQLHRTRGWAYMRMGDLDSAEDALLESLASARLDDENFGIMSTDYQVALTLGALVRLHQLRDEPAAELEPERDAIFEQLGVVKVHEPPLER